MKLSIFTFTDKGTLLGEKIESLCIREKTCEGAEVVRIGNGTLYDTVKSAWTDGRDIAFVGAMGIAVRAIAPLLVSKLTDRAVVVADEAGEYVIPVLSGHVGGADALAKMIAGLIQAVPVLTTASDVNGIKAFDEWATEEEFAILNRDLIKAVSAIRLAGEDIKIFLSGYDGKITYEKSVITESVTDSDVIIYGGYDSDAIRDLLSEYGKDKLILAKRSLIIGIGCKRGISVQEAEEHIDRVLKENDLDRALVCELATIDIKADEPALVSICDRSRYRLNAYSAKELKEVPGEYSASEFVEQTTGVDNVCERAAVRSGGRLLVKKTAGKGITVAVAVKDKAALYDREKKVNNIYIVGIGPGGGDGMTMEADRIMKGCDVLIGYNTYIDLVRDYYPGKEYISTPMKQEMIRCRMAYEAASEGKRVAVICSGDSGIYGMASLMYELMPEYNMSLSPDDPQYELTVIPGVTAAISGAALLGAPIGHDFCVISLSDLLTPWEVIEKRLKCAAKGDMCIVLYNPSSHKRADHIKRVVDLLSEIIDPDRICGIASLIGREGEAYSICSFNELPSQDIDMFCTVFIGSSTTKVIDGHMVTPRGYRV